MCYFSVVSWFHLSFEFLHTFYMSFGWTLRWFWYSILPKNWHCLSIIYSVFDLFPVNGMFFHIFPLLNLACNTMHLLFYNITAFMPFSNQYHSAFWITDSFYCTLTWMDCDFSFLLSLISFSCNHLCCGKWNTGRFYLLPWGMETHQLCLTPLL